MTPLWAVVTVGLLLACSTSAFGEHGADLPWTAPTANITCGKLVLGNKIGRKIPLTFSANAADIDCHYASETGKHWPYPDFFNNDNAHYWEVPQALYDEAPTNIDNPTVTFTTKDAAVVTATIKVKVKDDGTHYQDLASLTEKDSMEIQIVDPDGFKKVTVNVTTAYTPTQVSVGSSTVWQLTYQGADLPWAARVEIGISGRDYALNAATNALSPGGAGLLWTTIVSASESGTVTHNDSCYFIVGTPLGPSWASALATVNVASVPPDTGTYHVHAYKRHIKNKESGVAIPTAQNCLHWTDSTPTGGRHVD